MYTQNTRIYPLSKRELVKLNAELERTLPPEQLDALIKRAIGERYR